MRFYLKLCVILLLAVAAQTVYEISATVNDYPSEENCVVYYAIDASGTSPAEKRLASCTWLTRWVISDLIAAPVAAL